MYKPVTCQEGKVSKLHGWRYGAVGYDENKGLYYAPAIVFLSKKLWVKL